MLPVCPYALLSQTRVSLPTLSAKSASYGDVFENCQVVGIKDGDTYELLINGRSQVLRLAHIDAPEKGQPFGSRAKALASDLCYGRSVVVIRTGTDRYRRWIGEVYLPDGTCINKKMVSAGLAWHYTAYSKDPAYAQLEKEARDSRLGLWADHDAIAPWLWRGKKRSRP